MIELFISLALASTQYYHLDRLGSVQVVTNESGQQVESVVHQPYGTSLAYTRDGNALIRSSSDFGFTGHRSVDASGLIYMKARYYDPSIGLFVSHDPARQYPNPYSYADGDPLNRTDPSGMFSGTLRQRRAQQEAANISQAMKLRNEAVKVRGNSVRTSSELRKVMGEAAKATQLRKKLGAGESSTQARRVKQDGQDVGMKAVRVIGELPEVAAKLVHGVTESGGRDTLKGQPNATVKDGKLTGVDTALPDIPEGFIPAFYVETRPLSASGQPTEADTQEFAEAFAQSGGAVITKVIVGRNSAWALTHEGVVEIGPGLSGLTE